jgi:enoyl-CoA hydratase
VTDERTFGEHVRLTDEGGGVATLRLDRPPVNALTLEVWDALGEAARHLAFADDVAAVVLWGGPKVFCAGADVAAMAERSQPEMDAAAPRLQESFRALAQLPQITVAAVGGYALGGGCELALTADFRLAADNAQLGQPEIKLGVIPGAGGTQRLTRLVGVTKAKEMVFGGDFYDAEASRAMGLVDAVHPADEVQPAAVELARRYAAGPYALRLAKQAIDDGAEMDLERALRLETRLFAACFATEDQEAGMRAFLESGPGQATFQRR